MARKTLTAADLRAAGFPEPAPPPDPTPQRPAGSSTPAPACSALRAHDGCLFGGDPFPVCFAPPGVRRACPHGRG